MAKHIFNKGDYLTLRLSYSVNNRVHSMNLGFTVNTGCTMDPIVVARYIYVKFFKEIIYDAWASPVSPQYLVFYYGGMFFRLSSLEPLVKKNDIDREQFFRFYFYLINRERPVPLNIYGISKRDNQFIESFKEKVVDFLNNTITIPTTEGIAPSETSLETSSGTSWETSLETSSETFLSVSFAGVRSTPQILSLDEICSVDLKVLKLPKNQRDLLMQEEILPLGSDSDLDS